MSTVLVVRHGQASYGAADYDQLSPLGEEQGERLGRWLAERKQTIGAMYVGPSRRHQQTADAIARGAGANGLLIPGAQADQGLSEFPAFELFAMHAGVELHEAVADPSRAAVDFESLCHQWMLGTLDCGDLETAADFEARVVASLEGALAKQVPDTTTLLVTSGGPTMAVLKHVLGVPADRASPLLWTIANASVSSYRLREKTLMLTGFNRIAHLERQHVTYR